jgi:uncharacterized phage protein gp47/JayE
MADFPTRLDFTALSRAYIKQYATKIDPTLVDVAGSDVNIYVGVGSVLADAIIKQLGYSVARLTLDGAQGDDLDRYAWDRYQLTRKGASPALGTVRFFRQSAAALGGTIYTGTKLKTLAGSEYITTTDARFGDADLQATANVRAVNAGKATQVGKNQIRAFSSTSALFDTTIQVTNDETTAGGEDKEDDPTFRARIRTFWRTVRRGTLGAIEAGALTVPGVVSAQAIEALTGDAQPANVVNLYISDSSGVASQALADQVISALDDYRAGGIAVLVSTSIPMLINIQLALAFAAGTDTVTLTSTIITAVVAFVNSLPVNGPLYVGELFTALQAYVSDGLILNQTTIAAPTGDLIPSVGQTLRTLPNLVTTVAA